MLPPIFYTIINNYVNPLIYVLFGVAVLYFLWGVYKFVENSEEPGARSEGAQHILWGIIGIAIMMSAFAILRMTLDSIGVPDSQRPDSIQQLR